jgi:hypothetical protein
MILSSETLDLLDDTKFSPVLSVQERRNNREPQFSPTLEPRQLERARRLAQTFADDSECQ